MFQIPKIVDTADNYLPWFDGLGILFYSKKVIFICIGGPSIFQRTDSWGSTRLLFNEAWVWSLQSLRFNWVCRPWRIFAGLGNLKQIFCHMVRSHGTCDRECVMTYWKFAMDYWIFAMAYTLHRPGTIFCGMVFIYDYFVSKYVTKHFSFGMVPYLVVWFLFSPFSGANWKHKHKLKPH